jgi:hypothetical protein
VIREAKQGIWIAPRKPGRWIMGPTHEPSEEAVAQLQQMLDTPIEHQAASYELTFLEEVLNNGIELLSRSESEEETLEILRQMIKSGFVIGRSHANHLL